jgi:hypothetical protein
MKAEISSHIYA